MKTVDSGWPGSVHSGATRFSRTAFLGAFVLTAWWWILFLLGCPAPHYDDLFFTGVAVNLAQGGGLANPWIANWMIPFGTDAYYVQPPFHPVLLAGWIKLVGLGDQSLRAFTLTCGWIAALVQWQLARRAGLTAIVALAASLVGTGWLLGRGLRPDSLAVALVSLAALGLTAGNRLGRFGGSFCAAAVPFVQPFALAMVLPILVWRLWASSLDEKYEFSWKKACAHLLLSAAAGIIVIGLFVVCVDGNLQEFWRVFSAHARMRTTTPGDGLALLLRTLMTGWEPILKGPSLVVFGAAAIAGFWQADSRRRTQTVLALFLGFAVTGIVAYAGYVQMVLFGAAALATLYLLPTAPRAVRRPLVMAWIVGVALQFLPLAIQTLLREPARQEPAELRQAVDNLLKTPGRRLLVDEYAARRLYDWRLPPGSCDWLHSHFDPLHPVRRMKLADKRKEEVWLIDANKLERHFPERAPVLPRIMLFSHRTSMPLRPGHLIIVP